MALRFYDLALTQKIKNWVKDPNIKITSPDETSRLFEYRADISNDSPITLPLIAISRDPNFEILATNKKPLTFDAKTIEYNEDKCVELNGIPISLSYQLDIYTRYFEECDEYLRNFIFQLINFPKLTIDIPYNGYNLKHVSNIRVNSTVADNSAISERLVAGQFTRFTLSLYIDDAYLFSVPVRNNIKIDGMEIEVVE